LLPLSALAPSRQRRWWKRWRRTPPPEPPTAHVRTQIGGASLEADVPVRPDGSFEVSFTSELPAARRGWRIARHHITVAEHSLRACNVVLRAPADSGSGLIVVLPLEFTYEAEGVQRLRCVPRHPVVFCHGMLAMTMLRMQIPEDCNYFTHLRPFLRERGIEALYPNVEPTGGVAARAEQLRDLIRHWTDEPVNLIAHSMGGLDARYLISRLGKAAQVASLTTIAAPHHGTTVADWFCLNYRQRVPLLLTLEAFGINVDGFRDCRTDACRDFNERTPDAPGVRYFSYTAAVPSSRVSPLLRRAWNILTPAEGANDGLVSVRSAVWGEVLGTLSVDHFAQTPDGLFVRPGENFDALHFYSRLIEELAHRGL
jgi:triacylglycerol lipase